MLFLAMGLMLLQAGQATAYRNCISRETPRLERSGERPEDVATAVVEACRATMDRQLAELDHPENIIRQAREVVIARARNHVIAEVVRIRADRR